MFSAMICGDRPQSAIPALSRLACLTLGLALALATLTAQCATLPKRLILALDAAPYRDVKALQEGVDYRKPNGKTVHLQAFHRGYFPVSINVSCFPSVSDAAWTEIFGDRPLAGYQRTYYSTAANAEIYLNAVTSSTEFEMQMNWRVEGGLNHLIGYVLPTRAFRYETQHFVDAFLQSQDENFYALISSTDAAQHLSGDIMEMLVTVDERLEYLRSVYRQREGRELEVLIISDHGNNHAGTGIRLPIEPYLKAGGYRIVKRIDTPKDIVLARAGIESWVEIHNMPSETEKLLDYLSQLKGIDVITAKDPVRTNHFLIKNSEGARASFDWNETENTFSYHPETGDPIGYLPVAQELAKTGALGTNGFASADAWMKATFRHRYPLALERIARGHTKIALNPATILISLKNEYVNADRLIKKGSEFVTFGGTHGALDDLNSNGILLSNFVRTEDTSGNRVAQLFKNFEGLRDSRSNNEGAEWVSHSGQAMTKVARVPLDRSLDRLSKQGTYLRVWTPRFSALGTNVPVAVTLRAAHTEFPSGMGRTSRGPAPVFEERFTLNQPLAIPDNPSYERVYEIADLPHLLPGKPYVMYGSIQDGARTVRLFELSFYTDLNGAPAAY